MVKRFSVRLARHRTAPWRLVAAAALALGLGGCFRTQEPVAEARYPVDYHERHPIRVEQGERSVQIFLAGSRGSLDASQRADVLAFAQLWRHEASGGILIDVPASGPSQHAAVAALREVESIFAASGVPKAAIFVRRYQAAPTGLTSIRINFSKLEAKAGPCGIWPNDMGPAAGAEYRENRPYWNLGCASQRNLAAMVANPADLVQPRVERPAYEARRTIVLDKYRKGEAPSGNYTGYDQGKLSDLGK